MRTLIVNEWMSLDGVVQAPIYPDEDTSGGFEHGGWHRPYFDDVSLAWVVENLERAGGFVFGRRTYETFAAHWPNAGADEQALAEPLNTKPKWVASTGLTGPLPWRNSTLLKGDAADAVAALRQEDGGDLYVIGSTRLAQALIARDLVDEYRLMIDPIVVGGGGKRVFEDQGALRRLRLADHRVTSTGAVLATYARTA
jgi:dihydrofolate reductase